MSMTSNNYEITQSLFKVAVIDDHYLFAEALAMLLEKIDFVSLQGTYYGGKEFINDPQIKALDIVFTDLQMKDVDGFKVIDHLKQEYPHIKIVVVSYFSDAFTIYEAIQKGIEGYITKSAVLNIKDVFSYIERGDIYISPDVVEDYNKFLKIKNKDAYINDSGLTLRNLEIIKQLANGKNAKEIAEILCISKKTVEAEKKKIADKLGVKRTSEIIAKAYQHKLLK